MSATGAVAPPTDKIVDSDPRRWRMLGLLGLAELLGMSLWFAGSAVAPQLQERWALSASQVGWMTTAVQLGFVAGTAFVAVLNLADILPSKLLFAIAALLGATANAALLGVAGFPAAVGTRFLCGFCLAGVYPPAMKMIATWFKARRGLAVGTIVGALTVGKATPYLVHAIPGATVDTIILAGSVSAVLAAVLVPTAAQAQQADPLGSGPIVNALAWMQGTLLGNVATAVAVMAVAAVGFMMLTGRLNWRFGATVIIGCFVLFGAASIVSGIQAVSG